MLAEQNGFVLFKVTRSLAVRGSILSLGLLMAGLCSQAAAQSPAKPQESLETLTTDANDPTAILAQLKIENDYTVDEYGTQAEPNSIQIQPVIPVRPFSLMLIVQILGSLEKGLNTKSPKRRHTSGSTRSRRAKPSGSSDRTA